MQFTNKTLKVLSYPTEDFLSILNSQRKNFSYLLGSNTYWHNGIHFRTTEPIRAIYDAQVIAMRISEDYKNSYSFDSFPVAYRSAYLNNSFTDEFDELYEYSEGKYKLKSGLTDAQKEKAYYLVNELYSNNFILLKHSLKNAANKDIVFYSLYNHLKPIKKMSVKQRFDLFYFSKELKAVKGEDYYYIDAYDDFYNRIPTYKIPSETLLSEGESVQIKWTENGNKFKGIIKRRFIRTFSSDNLEIRRPLHKDETPSDTSEYLTPVNNYEELSKDDNIVIIYSTNKRSSRQAIGYVNKNTKLKINNKNNFETYLKTPSNTDGFEIVYKENDKEIKGYVFVEAEDIEDFSQKYNEWKELNKENDNIEYYYSAEQGIYNGENLIIEKAFTLHNYKIQVEHIFKYENGSSDESMGNGFILCEAKVDYGNEITQYSWTLNGKVYNGYIDENNIRELSGHKETKRYPRLESEKNNDKYLPVDYSNKDFNKIIIYSTASSSDRLVKAILSPGTVLYINSEESFNNYINKYNRETGLEIYYKNDLNILEKGYVYFDVLNNCIKTVKEQYNNWIKTIPNNSEEKKQFENIFEIKLKIINEAKYDSVFVPNNTTIQKNNIIGYSGYTITSDKDEKVWENEDATSVHFEIFTNNINFMKLKKGDAFSCKCKVNSDCILQAGELKTITSKKRLDYKSLLNLSGKEPDVVLNNIFNSDNSSYKNGILRYLKKGELIQGRVFYKMCFIGKTITLDKNEFVNRDECFTNWSDSTSSWQGAVDNKKANVYDSLGNIIKTKTVPIYKKYRYTWASPSKGKVINSEKKALELRKAKYFYELFDTPSVEFYIREEVFNQLILLNSKNDEYIMPEGTSIFLKDILEKPSVKKWTGISKKVLKDTELIYKNRIVREYSSFDTPIVTATWEEVGLKNDSQSYWVKQESIGGKGFSPIEKIIYDEWNNFFELLEIDKIDKYKCSDKDENLQKLNLSEMDIQDYKFEKNNNYGAGNTYNLSEFLNSSGKTDYYYFENETEWNGNSALTESICKNTELEEKVKKQRNDYKFWDEAKNLKDFPKSNNNKLFFFHPISFIQHLEEVCQVPDLNPYANANIAYFASPEDRAKGKLSYYQVKDSPGFSPIYTWGTENYSQNGTRYGCITGSFNEDYAGLDAYKNKWKYFYHEGVDLRGTWDKNKPKEKGTPIKALINCKVIAYGWYITYGQVIFLKKKNDKGVYLLAHLSYIDENIYEGKEYNQGDTVAYVGGSAYINNEKKLDHWTPHLHLSYYDANEDYNTLKNNIYSKNGLIEIKNAFITSFKKNRKNPFDHNSSPKKDNIPK